MATYRKRGSRWQCRVHSAELGRMIAGSGVTKRLAREQAEMRRRAAEDGLSLDAERLTVGKYFERWLTQHALNVDPVTLCGYQKRLARYVIPWLGHVRLASLRAAQVQELYTWRSTACRLRPGTIRSTHVALHKPLEDAVRMQLVARNVATGVSLPKPPRCTLQAPEPGDAKRVLRAVAGTSVEAEATFAMYTCVRQGELLGLRWADVNLDGGNATIYRSGSRIPRQGHSAQGSKDAEKRAHDSACRPSGCGASPTPFKLRRAASASRAGLGRLGSCVPKLRRDDPGSPQCARPDSQGAGEGRDRAHPLA